MSSSISKELSKCFQLASIVATILVVSIHYQSKYYIQGHDSWNFLIQEFLTNGIARVAVPFFALSSGFFFYLKYNDLSSYKKNLRKRISSILVPYIICSFVMFITQYFYLTVLKGSSYPLNIETFLHKIFIVPVSVQLWFLRDLMFLFLFSPVIFFLINKCSLIGLILVGILWFADVQLMPMLGGKYLISIETLFFFYLGGFLVLNKEYFDDTLKNATDAVKLFALIFFLFLVSIRVFLDPTFLLSYSSYDYQISSLVLYKLYILIGVGVLLCISYGKSFKGLSFIASFTFFVFLYHLIPLSYVVTKLGHFLLPDAYVFYFNFPFAIILTFFSAYFLNKFLPKLYSVLAGGRVG